jgi:hypothetical protein
MQAIAGCLTKAIKPTTTTPGADNKKENAFFHLIDIRSNQTISKETVDF